MISNVSMQRIPSYKCGRKKKKRKVQVVHCFLELISHWYIKYFISYFSHCSSTENSVHHWNFENCKFQFISILMFRVQPANSIILIFFVFFLLFYFFFFISYSLVVDCMSRYNRLKMKLLTLVMSRFVWLAVALVALLQFFFTDKRKCYS